MAGNPNLARQDEATDAPPSPYSRHIPSLDGLRGLAVLGVVASHLFWGNPAGPWTAAIESITVFGAHGVDLFFVLSGFLITGILYDSLQEESYFRKFYARRCLRIFPLYYGVLIVLFLLTPLLHWDWNHTQWYFVLYLQNLPSAIRLNHGAGQILDHFWSLAVEEQFYLVWPLLVFFVAARARLMRLAFALCCAALLLRLVLIAHSVDYNIINRGTLSRADSLLMGALLALLLRGPAHDRILRFAPTVLYACVGVYGAGLILYHYGIPAIWSRQTYNTVFVGFGFSILSLFSAALIAMCLRHGSFTARAFTSPTLRFFGKYSYGLYVLHGIAMFWRAPFRRLCESISPSKYLSIGGSGLLIFILGTAAAFLSYNLYEKHFLKLKRYFDYGRAAKPAKTVETL